MGKGKPRHNQKPPIEVPTDNGTGLRHPDLLYDIDICADTCGTIGRVEIWTDAGEVVVYSNGAVEGP